ncbi:lipase member H-B-like [Helicoverpa zea]|uniref:lipase member H-B-like n=1 Tax=Helicoverpa zea TaxID=7113 RepID=UPI001F5A3C64|nr:lipase member H-B-like [Helicoverpa zea]
MYLNILKTAFLVLCLLELTQAASLRCFNGTLTNYIEAPLDNATLVKPLLTKNFTMIFTGGWESKPSGPANTAMMQACFTKNDTNCCILNWETEASCALGYACVVNRVETVGDQFGAALVVLLQNGILFVERLILMGHSLGSHVNGGAGRRTAASNYTLQRMTGLDPAGPLFNPPSTYRPFSYTDADYTEVVHTDAGGYGIRNSTVSVQFWPNTDQPNSQNACVGSTDPMCSHNMAWRFAAESITRNGSFVAIYAVSYQSWLSGGGDPNRTLIMTTFFDQGQRGAHYLRTRATSPYGLYQNGTSPN